MADISSRRHAPATLRNRQPILSVLKDVLPDFGTVLEIASGSGEHTAYFAPHFPDLTWQPTDIERDNFPSIRSWADDGASTILDPIYLDTREQPWQVKNITAILCMNMSHISPWTSTEGLMQGAGTILNIGGILFLYGPFRQEDVPLAPSNASFDDFLKTQDPAWGLRELRDVEDLARQHALILEQVIEMPANNLSVVFRKQI